MIVFERTDANDFIGRLRKQANLLIDEVVGSGVFFLTSVVSLADIDEYIESKVPIEGSVVWLNSSESLGSVRLRRCVVIVSDDIPNRNEDCIYIQTKRGRDLFGEVTRLIGEITCFESVRVDSSNKSVTIYSNVEIAGNVEVGPYTSIGGQGFGFYSNIEGRKTRFRHLGGCVIGSGCEIGACVTIDGGIVSPTILGKDVKIDSNVHIGHNARIGDGTIICASATVCGSVRIGENVFIGAGAIIMDRIVIPDNCVVGLGAVVRKSPKEASTIIPVFQNRQRRKM